MDAADTHFDFIKFIPRSHLYLSPKKCLWMSQKAPWYLTPVNIYHIYLGNDGGLQLWSNVIEVMVLTPTYTMYV
jgi:hypothetical protein